MSIRDLLRGMPRAGVPYLELQEMFDTRNGYTPPKADDALWADGTIPWFRMEDIRENGGVLDDSIRHIPEAAVKGGRLFPADSILVATSATIGEHALVRVPHLSNQRFTSLALKARFRDEFDMKFLYYYCFLLDDWCRTHTTVSSFASVDMAAFKRFRFPVVPIELQREIARVLDTFVGLQDQLTEELSARRRQYAHCRARLLSFPGSADVHRVPLGDLAGFATARVDPASLDESSYVGVDNLVAGFGGRVDATYLANTSGAIGYRPGDILIGNIRPYLKKVWLADRAGGASPDVLTLALREKGRTLVLPRYLYFVLASDEFVAYSMQHAKGAKMPRGDKAAILRYEVPVPPLAEQQRIIDTLGAFDALVNDSAVGIPAELAARRKQYEHYRNRLLTFPEAA